jgi:peroxiredoxin 2/4
MTTIFGKPAPTVPAFAYVRGEFEPRRISLADYRGRWAVLVFYPRDFTFVCPTELVAFADLEGEFAVEGADVLAVSTDSYWTHRAWLESHPKLDVVEYPVLADTTQALTRAFGVLGDDGAALRGTFVIDPEGTVRHASVTDANVGRSADDTLRVLQALRTGELCPADWRPGRPTLRAA